MASGETGDSIVNKLKELGILDTGLLDEVKARIEAKKNLNQAVKTPSWTAGQVWLSIRVYILSDGENLA